MDFNNVSQKEAEFLALNRGVFLNNQRSNNINLKIRLEIDEDKTYKLENVSFIPFSAVEKI